MAEFRVYRNNSASSDHYPFLVDVQAELLSMLETRLVIPLIHLDELGGKTMRNLNPRIEIGHTVYVILTQQMAAVPKSMCGDVVNEVTPNRNEILSAIDFLVTGI